MPAPTPSSSKRSRCDTATARSTLAGGLFQLRSQLPEQVVGAIFVDVQTARQGAEDGLLLGNDLAVRRGDRRGEQDRGLRAHRIVAQRLDHLAQPPFLALAGGAARRG